MDDQREIVTFLSDGASYGKPGARVERIETHISLLFLVECRVYKLKRAVLFSYLDYSTTALRERYCKREITLNQRTAPTLYRRVHAITRGADGNLTFDGKGAALDWVVEMRRFSESNLFDRLADARKLSPALMRDLTDVIATFHRTAEITPRYGGRASTEETIVGNELNLIAACPLLDRMQVDALHTASMAKLTAAGPLLERRRRDGRVRQCHGDLHLRNICLIDNHPTLFDCIEFSDALSCIDVLYDLAFLLMDLVHRDLQGLASVVFNRYLDITGDVGALATFPLFMSMRAAVRAHVLAVQARQSPSAKLLDEARSYLSLAVGLLHPSPPRLIAIGGLSGTGKSTVAQALAPNFHPAPGARLIRSDVLRKRLFDVAPETRLPSTAYEVEVTERVYNSLREQVAATLAAGYTTIADATFLSESERESMAALAKRAGVPFLGFWLEAPVEVLEARLNAREHDASDADIAVLRRQFEVFSDDTGWYRIDAQPEIRAVLATVRARIIPMWGPIRSV